MPAPYSPLIALDTAAAQCAVAVIGPGLACARAEAQLRGQSERLLPMILEIVSEAGLAMSDLAAIAVTVGPGSFTGLRVGLAAAQGLALARDIPAVGIDSFAAFAASLPPDAPFAAMDRAVVIESRRAELYWQILNPSGIALTEPANTPLDDIARALHGRDVLICGDGCLPLRDALPGHPMIVQPHGPDPLAIANLGLERLASGAAIALPTALYIRPPDAKPAAKINSERLA